MDISDPRKLDKFYTRPEVAAACMHLLDATLRDLSPEPFDLWVEPSAGSGAFLNILPLPRIGIDLVPEAPGIEAGDFLSWRPPGTTRRVAVVGNPPFGKNASKAVSFFNHAATFAEIIAMIFPRTFEKASIHRRLDRNFHCALDRKLGHEAFTFLGQSYNVPATFQIWIRGAIPRLEPAPLRSHDHFEFVDRSNADFAFQRVGVKAGAIKFDLSSIADASHLFIRAVGFPPDVIASRIAALPFAELKERTAGNPSIAKSELIALYARSLADGK